MSPTEKPAPWIGASGTQYIFHVFGLAPNVPSRLGNFIYAKRNAEGAWVPIYMGHGDLAACCDDPARLRCIAEKSATHIHLRLNSRDADREAELQDLLAHYANAFAPEGCHQSDPKPTVAGAPASGSIETPAATKRGKAAKKAATKTSTKKPTTKKTATRKAAAKKTAVKKPKTPRPRSR